MTFKVDLSEVNSMADKIKATSNVLEKDLHNVTRELDELITLDSFQGETASNAKHYFDNVHQTAIQSIQLIANQLSSNIHMHIDSFNEDVDNSTMAKIEYDYLQDVKENIQTHHVDIEDSVQNIAHTIDDISDIITIDSPSFSDIQTSKNNADQTVDQLTNNVELFTEKGTDQDEEMKEMLHHLEALIAEASTNTGEASFATVQSPSIAQPLSFLDEANQVLKTSQTEKQKEVMLEKRQEAFSQMSEMMENSTLSVKYEKKPSTIVEFSQSVLEGFKGGGKAIYQLTEEAIQMIVDFPETFKALESMIAHPIDTAKYIGHAVTESFNRDVIHGDAESRGQWFTYAAFSVFGSKGLGNAGKIGAQAAKKGAQKTVQRLDELLPYHPKHQLAIDGPVPYNVYDGVNLRDQLITRFSKHFTDSKKTKLMPNITYRAGEFNYLYKTDNLGRIKTFSTDNLQLTKRDGRLPHNPNTPGKQPGDHAGHLAGDRFGGSPDLDNLVSQLSNVNLSQYKIIEEQWAAAIKQGKDVKIDVSIQYSGSNIRPSGFRVEYSIDGTLYDVQIKN